MIPNGDRFLNKLSKLINIIKEYRDGRGGFLPTQSGMLIERRLNLFEVNKKEQGEINYCVINLNDLGDLFNGISVIIFDNKTTYYLCGFEKETEQRIIFCGKKDERKDLGLLLDEKNSYGKFLVDIEYHDYSPKEVEKNLSDVEGIITGLIEGIFRRYAEKQNGKEQPSKTEQDEFFEPFVIFCIFSYECARNPALKHIVEYIFGVGAEINIRVMMEVIRNYSKMSSLGDIYSNLVLSWQNLGYASFNNYIIKHEIKKETIIGYKDKVFYYTFCRMHTLYEYARLEQVTNQENAQLSEIFGLDKARIDALFDFGDPSLKNNLNCLILIELFLHVKFIFPNGKSAKEIIKSYTEKEFDHKIFIHPLMELMKMEWEQGKLSHFDGHEEYSEEQRQKERFNIVNVLASLGDQNCKIYFRKRLPLALDASNNTSTTKDSSKQTLILWDQYFCEIICNIKEIAKVIFPNLEDKLREKEVAVNLKEKIYDLLISSFLDQFSTDNQTRFNIASLRNGLFCRTFSHEHILLREAIEIENNLDYYNLLNKKIVTSSEQEQETLRLEISGASLVKP